MVTGQVVLLHLSSADRHVLPLLFHVLFPRSCLIALSRLVMTGKVELSRLQEVQLPFNVRAPSSRPKVGLMYLLKTL